MNYLKVQTELLKASDKRDCITGESGVVIY